MLSVVDGMLVNYDAVGQRTALADWTGRYTSSYDADGRTASTVDPHGFRITHGYDAVANRKRMACTAGRFT